MATKKKLEVGGDIDSTCTKCKEVTYHTIVSMVEEKPARVLCKICKGEHNYRAPKKAKAAAKKKAPKVPKISAKQAKHLKLWASLCGETDPVKAMPYGMDKAFKVDDVIMHKTFGMGAVTAVYKPNKMEVIFEAEVKLMRCDLL